MTERRRWLAAAALAAAVTLAVVLPIVLTGGGAPRHRARTPAPTPTTASSTPAPAPASEQLGASVNRLFNSQTFAAAQVDAQLAALAATGATLARSDALWEAAEPVPPTGTGHRYDWSFADRIAGALASRGLRWLPIIDYSAPWAQSVPGRDHSPPSDPAAYAAYAGAFAARYGSGGSFWTAHPELHPLPVQAYEIWNEPDNPVFWFPRPDAAAYDRLYAQARQAITGVQPGAQVLVGGLTDPRVFLPGMLASDPSLRGAIDGVAIHPYGRTPGLVLRSVRSARLALDSQGMERVPLWITELGWTTSPPGALDYLPERLRPRYIERTITALGRVDCGIAATILYTWLTPEVDRSDPQDWFGINPPAGGSSPDVNAFTAGIRAARAPAPTLALCGG